MPFFVYLSSCFFLMINAFYPQSTRLQSPPCGDGKSLVLVLCSRVCACVTCVCVRVRELCVFVFVCFCVSSSLPALLYDGLNSPVVLALIFNIQLRGLRIGGRLRIRVRQQRLY